MAHHSAEADSVRQLVALVLESDALGVIAIGEARVVDKPLEAVKWKIEQQHVIEALCCVCGRFGCGLCGGDRIALDGEHVGKLGNALRVQAGQQYCFLRSH